ncbi:MAG: DNA cytosine methyltransferase, partial [Gemmatimonadetes bacterium]|nr:DNA cytosine methyltransferase [Gemmatimonadota bacterium]
MTDVVPVVDLFSGPGGLAEGFAAYRDARDQPRFRVLLSVEMEKSAYQTLRLRAFLRKFEPSDLPSEYH